MSVGAIDIGTNSIRLLIVDNSGHEIVRQMQITRLGQGVDRTGRLASDAIDRTIDVLSRFGAELAERETRDVRAVATSAVRDASNRDEFFAAVSEALGFVPEMIVGDDEARLGFLGATAGLAQTGGPFLIVDIGGGSTEFTLGTTRPDESVSVNMGCVRVTERYFDGDDPPTADELDRAREMVNGILEDVRSQIDIAAARTLVGLGGTVTSLGAMAAGLTSFDPATTNGMVLSVDTARRLYDDLRARTVAQRRELLVDPARADVILGGALILDEILERFGFGEIVVSERDILDGLVDSLLGDGSSSA